MTSLVSLAAARTGMGAQRHRPRDPIPQRCCCPPLLLLLDLYTHLLAAQALQYQDVFRTADEMLKQTASRGPKSSACADEGMPSALRSRILSPSERVYSPKYQALRVASECTGRRFRHAGDPTAAAKGFDCHSCPDALGPSADAFMTHLEFSKSADTTQRVGGRGR